MWIMCIPLEVTKDWALLFGVMVVELKIRKRGNGEKGGRDGDKTNWELKLNNKRRECRVYEEKETLINGRRGKP